MMVVLTLVVWCAAVWLVTEIAGRHQHPPTTLRRRQLDALPRIGDDDLLHVLASVLQSEHILKIELPRPRCSCGWVADWSAEWSVMVGGALAHHADIRRQQEQS